MKQRQAAPVFWVYKDRLNCVSASVLVLFPRVAFVVMAPVAACKSHLR